MRNIIFSTIFLMIIPAISYASPQDTIFNQSNQQGQKEGWWKTYYSNGHLRYVGYFSKGFPQGNMTRYYDDGTLKAKLFYRPDGHTVHALLFYNNGQSAAEGNYIDSKKDSIWKYYSFYTENISTEESYKNGQREGISKKYYDTGELFEEIEYQHDVKDGRWIQYFENGKTRLISSYKKGVRTGIFQTFYESGQPEIKGSFSDNLMDGDWHYYDESHTEKMVIRYSKGIAQNPEPLDKIDREYYKRIEESKGRYPEPDETNFLNVEKQQ